MIYTHIQEFKEAILKHHNCTLYINKRFEQYLTRMYREDQHEIKSILKRHNIELKLVKQPSDDWEKDWNWTGRSKYE